MDEIRNRKIVHLHSTDLDENNQNPKLPTAEQIEYGELAINYASGKETIALKNNLNEIVSISMNQPFEYNENGSGIQVKNNGSTASGIRSHAEGYNTTASEECSHAEGYNTTASGRYSHAEGYNTRASGRYSHAEGYNTTASGSYSHAEGDNTTASGSCSHAEGYSCTNTSELSHIRGEYSHIIGGHVNTVNGYNNLCQVGNYNILNGYCNVNKGYNNVMCSSGAYCTSSTRHIFTNCPSYSNGEFSIASGLYTASSGSGNFISGQGTGYIHTRGKITSKTSHTFVFYLDSTDTHFIDDNNILTNMPDEYIPWLFHTGERYFFKTWEDCLAGTKKATAAFAASLFKPTYDNSSKTITFDCSENYNSLYENGIMNSDVQNFFNKFGENEEFFITLQCNNFIVGDRTILSGLNNCAMNVYDCIVEGTHNKCFKNENIVSGAHNYLNTTRSIVVGENNRVTGLSDNSITCGYYNADTQNALLCVGIGSESERRNALLVDNVGNCSTYKSWTTTSDIRLKDVKNENLSVSTEDISEAPVFTYSFKSQKDGGEMIGSSAQYWQNILPESVKEDKEGYLSLDYNGILLTCIKSMAKEIEELKKEINELKNKK